jgi:hypothetical protein
VRRAGLAIITLVVVTTAGLAYVFGQAGRGPTSVSRAPAEADDDQGADDDPIIIEETPPEPDRPPPSDPATASAARAARIADAVAAGGSWRLRTARGPVHVWRPEGYHGDGAATVVYVHGYYTDVDGAWSEYQLPEQFALAGINALFIAPEAPSGSRPPVYWTSLGELLRTVHAETGTPRPSGPVIAIGHSGAYRTLMTWLDYPLLDTIVLLDAMYGELEPFREWLEAAPSRRLINVGDDTVRWTEDLAHQTEMLEIDRFPPQQLPAEASRARAVYVRSQFGHMGLVTGGVALPQLLRSLPVDILPGAPWDEPLGVLPRAIVDLEPDE